MSQHAREKSYKPTPRMPVPSEKCIYYKGTLFVLFNVDGYEFGLCLTIVGFSFLVVLIVDR